MRATSPVLVIFAAICIAAAGCSGGNAPGLPSAPGVASPAISHDAASANAVNPCRGKSGCHAQLVAPVTFNGRTFTMGYHGSCNTASRPFTATHSGRFVLGSNVTLKPQCVPKSMPSSQLYLAVANANAAPADAINAIGVNAGSVKSSVVPLSAPVRWRGKSWTFVPKGSGMAMKAHAKYLFWIVSVPMDGTSPSPGPTQSPSSNYVLLQPLGFDGTNFSVVADSCFESDPQDAPPYVAPSSGALTLSGPVSVTPTCVPSPLPSASPLPQLYIVAVDLTYSVDAVHAARHHHATAHGFAVPMDDGSSVPAVAIAGGVNVTDNPWSFAPDSPCLTMTAGTSYAFFIAAQAAPTPPPTQTYDAVAPLNFDGTTFTIPSISDCTNLPSPAPYGAASSGPLTLAGNVSLTPTCVPNPYGGGGGGDSARRLHPADGGSSAPAPLYIVVSPVCSMGSGDDASHRLRPHDGGGCGSSGGDSKRHIRPNDGGGGSIDGYAIAGPVNATDNPWDFAPIAPPVVLTAGMQYTFYIGSLSGDSGGGGDLRHR